MHAPSRPPPLYCDTRMMARTPRHPGTDLRAGILLALALSAPTASALDAQEQPPVVGAAPAARLESDVGRRAAGALIGSLSGFLAGSLLANTTATPGPDDWAGVLVGGLIGSAILAPVGAHFFDDEPGSISAPLAATAALTAFALVSGAEGTTVLLVLPVGQILTATLFGRDPR